MRAERPVVPNSPKERARDFKQFAEGKTTEEFLVEVSAGLDHNRIQTASVAISRADGIHIPQREKIAGLMKSIEEGSIERGGKTTGWRPNSLGANSEGVGYWGLNVYFEIEKFQNRPKRTPL
jgi:hypothetical protein